MGWLDEVVAAKQQAIRQAKSQKPLSQLEKGLKHRPSLRDFASAIHRPGQLSLIAEFKRASPSRGAICPKADVCRWVKMYWEAGAQAISVLTDSQFFLGSLQDLQAAKEEVPLPILRKDFLLDEYQVVESAWAGADAVLLIASILSPDVLKRLWALTKALSMEALVEVHTERELDQALEMGAKVIGINNRNLATLSVDLKTTERLVPKIPSDRIKVSESGFHSPDQIGWVRSLGVDAVLIGEEFLSHEDPKRRIKELLG